MSGAITTPFSLAPLTSAATLVQNGSPSWHYGSWIEFIPAAAGNVSVAGLILTGAYAFGVSEFDVGIGTAGNEVSLQWNIRVKLSNTGNMGLSNYFLRVPAVTGSVAGDRICIRSRGDNVYQHKLILIYYTDAGFDVISHRPYSVPVAAVDASITPSNVSWNNSAWTTLTTGLPYSIYIMGVSLASAASPSKSEWEADIAVTASKTIIGTVDGLNTTAQRNTRNYLLPALYQLSANEPVYVRIRAFSTDTTAWDAALLYYGEPSTAGIVVQKFVTGGDATFSFQATGMSPASFYLSSGQQQVFSVSPGSGYGVSENPLEGWELVSTSVSNGSPVNNIAVGANETVTVTFTNGPTGHPGCWPLFPTDSAECN